MFKESTGYDKSSCNYRNDTENAETTINFSSSNKFEFQHLQSLKVAFYFIKNIHVMFLFIVKKV